METNFENYLNLFLDSDLCLGTFCKQYNLDKREFEEYLISLNYHPGKKKGKAVKSFKNAVDYYCSHPYSPSVAAKEYGINAQSLASELKLLGLWDESKSGIKKKTYNEFIFDNIDTEEKAYWLGFIYADGYIYNTKPRTKGGQMDYNFELSLKASDISHLQKFANFIGYKSELKISNPDPQHRERYKTRVCLSSKHLWETLNSKGCTPRKSLTLKFPDESIFIESDKYSKKELIRHFIRGYFDGDGCITYHNKEHNEISIQVLGTEEFLSGVIKYSDINTTLYHNHNNPEEITMQIRLASRKAFSFVEYLYNNCTIFLERKYERYLHFCRIYK